MRAASSASWSVVRLCVPSSSRSAVKEARPGLSRGFISLPLKTVSPAETMGRLCCSTSSTVRPLASLNLFGTGSESLEAAPAAGCGGRRRCLLLRLGRLRRVVNHLLSGHAVDHDALLPAQLFLCQFLRGSGRGLVVTLQVF